MKNQRLQPLQEVKAPAIEPVVKGDYKIIAEHIKAHCAVHETYTMTSEDLLKAIPQNKRADRIAYNLRLVHGLSYRKTDGENNNDTYVFFVEPTREELTVQLTSAESKVIEWEKTYKEQINKDLKEINLLNGNIKKIKEEKTELSIKNYQLTEENGQLKSDLENKRIDIGKYLMLGVILGSLLSRLYLQLNGL